MAVQKQQDNDFNFFHDLRPSKISILEKYSFKLLQVVIAFLFSFSLLAAINSNTYDNRIQPVAYDMVHSGDMNFSHYQDKMENIIKQNSVAFFLNSDIKYVKAYIYAREIPVEFINWGMDLKSEKVQAQNNPQKMAIYEHDIAQYKESYQSYLNVFNEQVQTTGHTF